jgi:hypothetical protein
VSPPACGNGVLDDNEFCDAGADTCAVGNNCCHCQVPTSVACTNAGCQGEARIRVLCAPLPSTATTSATSAALTSTTSTAAQLVSATLVCCHTLALEALMPFARGSCLSVLAWLRALCPQVGDRWRQTFQLIPTAPDAFLRSQAPRSLSPRVEQRRRRPPAGRRRVSLGSAARAPSLCRPGCEGRACARIHAGLVFSITVPDLSLATSHVAVAVSLGSSTVAGAAVMMYNAASAQWVRPEDTCAAALSAPQRVSASGATLYFVAW